MSPVGGPPRQGRGRRFPGALAAAALGLAAACATLPAPRIFGQIAAVRSSPAAQAARELAPQAFLAAEKLQEQSHQAHEAGDLPAAEVLGEHAVAAYEHAFVLARLARATERLQRAETEVEGAERALAELDEQQRRIAADADAIELRAMVLRDREALPTSGPAGPDREEARREAVRSFLLHARLLCTATRMLTPTGVPAAGGAAAPAPATDEVGRAFAELDSLEGRAGRGEAAPIDEAVRIRSRCLAELTRARRAHPVAAAGAVAPDALLQELAEQEAVPFVFRDDRGVVVVVRGLFTAGDELTAGAAATLASLASIAARHPAFPVLVVVHGGRPGSRRATTHAERVAAALRQGGTPRVETAIAGDVLPLVEPGSQIAAERNARIEIVFVAPSP